MTNIKIGSFDYFNFCSTCIFYYLKGSALLALLSHRCGTKGSTEANSLPLSLWALRGQAPLYVATSKAY